MSSFIKVSITGQEASTILARRRALSRAASLVASKTSSPPPAPYIKAGTPHYIYALLITQHASQEEALTLMAEHGIKISVRTAQGWHSLLCKAGSAYFGEDVEYAFLADFCTNEQTRSMYEQFDRELREAQLSDAGLNNANNRKPTPKNTTRPLS